MSKKQNETNQSQGQRGPRLKLEWGDLSKNEQKVLQALSNKDKPVLTIKELVEACGWKSLKASDANEDFRGKARGNSRVRNALRRLTRAGLVKHAKKVGDGKYRLGKRGEAMMAEKAPKRTKRAAKKEETAEQASA